MLLIISYNIVSFSAYLLSSIAFCRCFELSPTF